MAFVQGIPGARVASDRRQLRMCATTDKSKVLFVCLGNICRSPTAEAMFTSVVQKKDRESKFEIDSCGTGGGNPYWYRDGGHSYHEGDPADPRMRVAANGRGVKLTSRSRPLKPEDLEKFDKIIAMDSDNVEAIMTAASHWGPAYKKLALERTSMMLDYSSDAKQHGRGVPDPYYGGSGGFELVLDLVDDACEGLLEAIESEKAAQPDASA